MRNRRAPSPRADHPSAQVKEPSWKRHGLQAGLAVLAAFLALAAGELALRAFAPRAVLYPRWEFSPRYGLVLPACSTVVHARPGRWRFAYTLDARHCRGDPGPPPGPRGVKKIVVLGDSFSMGVGVADGEEYPAVLGRALGPGYLVVNLGMGGWGLCQEVRRFYDLGIRYHPAWVILQFCMNDPAEDRRYPVAAVEEGRIVFRDLREEPGSLERLLSRSALIQHSQLYALARALLSGSAAPPAPPAGGEPVKASILPGHARSPLPEEQAYIDLLEAFARDLSERGIPLVMIGVNGHLRRFPAILRAVQRLHARGRLRHLEVSDWFSLEGAYLSPEGLHWGRKAHAEIGAHLAAYLRKNEAGNEAPADR